jgi:hypothetical protein
MDHFIGHLPSEILYSIFDWFSVADLLQCRKVSFAFHRLLRHCTLENDEFQKKIMDEIEFYGEFETNSDGVVRERFQQYEMCNLWILPIGWLSDKIPIIWFLPGVLKGGIMFKLSAVGVVCGMRLFAFQREIHLSIQDLSKFLRSTNDLERVRGKVYAIS